ncbi:MAG TPA: protein translocase SEC61 complex subunit gamma [Candidatus Poseidoniales archaeon]|nr:MAG TPA: protein translocase SEC61 complex subunit gamma [Candidatus Poseidoniales archaeon]
MLKWAPSVARAPKVLAMAVETSQKGPIEARVQSWQDEIEGRVRRLQTGSTARILKMAKKPSKMEFRQTVIVCGIGMFVLGMIGFVVLALMDNALPVFFNWLTGS